MAHESVDPEMPPLQPQDGSFDWIRRQNDPESRAKRLAVAQDTLVSSLRGWYWHQGVPVSFKAVQKMHEGTRLLEPPKSGAIKKPSPVAGAGQPPAVVYQCTEAATVMDCAVPLAASGRRVAVVSAASAYQAGGGFETGGRHALEEAICVQTTLFRGLRRIRDEVKAPHGKPYIQATSAVVSKQVEVFREGSSQGYVTMSEPVELAAIVSIAMPNLNPQVRDSKAETYALNSSYRSAIRSRWRAALAAAADAGASDLVVPDAGCGVFKNNAGVVGEELGTLLNGDGKGCVKEVWLVGGDNFCRAVSSTCGGLTPCPQLPQRRTEEDNNNRYPDFGKGPASASFAPFQERTLSREGIGGHDRCPDTNSPMRISSGHSPRGEALGDDSDRLNRDDVMSMGSDMTTATMLSRSVSWINRHGVASEHRYVHHRGSMMIESVWDSGLRMRVYEAPEMAPLMEEDETLSVTEEDALTVSLLRGTDKRPDLRWDILGLLGTCGLDSRGGSEVIPVEPL